MPITQDVRAALASEQPPERLRRLIARELEAGVPRERVIAQNARTAKTSAAMAKTTA